MARFTEPELCLLENWTDARLLEDSMKAVRLKYAEIIEEVKEKVQQNHRELDCSKVYVRRDGTEVNLAIGKDSWPKSQWGWPSGFSIDDLQLENLTSPEEYPPSKCIYIYKFDEESVKDRLTKAAERVLGKEQSQRWEPIGIDDVGGGIFCKFESRQVLVRMLVKNETQEFVDCLVTHFEQMVKLAAELDEIIQSLKQARKRSR